MRLNTTYITRCGLAGDVDVPRHDKARVDVDHTADSENDDAVWLGDGVTEGASTRVAVVVSIQIRPDLSRPGKLT